MHTHAASNANPLLNLSFTSCVVTVKLQNPKQTPVLDWCRDMAAQQIEKWTRSVSIYISVRQFS